MIDSTMRKSAGTSLVRYSQPQRNIDSSLASPIRAAAAIALRPAALRRRFFGALVTMALFAGEASCALW